MKRALIEQSHTTRQSGTRRILFAEDHDAVRQVMKLLLTREGYVVHQAENGVEALDLFHANPGGYDLLITDHDMPKMNGIELVKKLRRAKFRGGIIVISGGLSSRCSADYLKLNVSRIVAKPVSGGALSRMIEETCSQTGATELCNENLFAMKQEIAA